MAISGSIGVYVKSGAAGFARPQGAGAPAAPGAGAKTDQKVDTLQLSREALAKYGEKTGRALKALAASGSDAGSAELRLFKGLVRQAPTSSGDSAAAFGPQAGAPPQPDGPAGRPLNLVIGTFDDARPTPIPGMDAGSAGSAPAYGRYAAPGPGMEQKPFALPGITEASYGNKSETAGGFPAAPAFAQGTQAPQGLGTRAVKAASAYSEAALAAREEDARTLEEERAAKRAREVEENRSAGNWRSSPAFNRLA